MLTIIIISIYGATERSQPFVVGAKIWKIFADVKLQPQRTTRHNRNKIERLKDEFGRSLFNVA